MMCFSMAVSILPVSGVMPEAVAMLPVTGGSNMQAGAGGFLVACGVGKGVRNFGICSFLFWISA